MTDRTIRKAPLFEPARPRLIGRPSGWTLDDVRRWLDDVERAWSALARHGFERLVAGGWRQLGVGAVHHTADVFERLATPLCVVWSTLDARDGWDQSVVQIALRQRCWFTARTRPVLSALGSSFFDVYRVVRNRGQELLLSRATDGRMFRVHATFDDGAYPRDRYVVARLVVDDVACASLASAVVSGERLMEVTRRGRPTSRRAWGQILFDLTLERLVRAAGKARHDSLDSVFVAPGPRRTRRLHRAFDAIQSGMSGRDVGTFEYGHRECSLCVESGRRGTQVVLARRGGVRTRFRRVASSLFTSADREVARQAGIDPNGGLIEGASALSAEDWPAALETLVRAAQHLHRRRRRAA